MPKLVNGYCRGFPANFGVDFRDNPQHNFHARFYQQSQDHKSGLFDGENRRYVRSLMRRKKCL